MTGLVLAAACGRQRASSSLQQAAQSGDVAAIGRLLDAGADPNRADDEGVTPLLAAIFAGHLSAAQTLLERGADGRRAGDIASAVLASQDPRVPPGRRIEVTPLLAAAFAGDAGITRLLLERGADPRAASREGATPLHLAALRGNDEVARILLDHGADVSARNAEGQTPLLLAAAGGHDAVALELLAAGAGTGSNARDGQQALQIALEQRDTKLVQTLELHGVTLPGGGAVEGGTIATAGVDSHAPAAIDDALQALLPGRVQPRGIALDLEHGRIYWAEYEADRIRSTDLDGRDTRVVVDDVDGPIGVAVDAAHQTIFWTSDASYPRSIRRADLDGSSEVTISEGPPVNRPRAIAVDSARGEVVWTEAISGRVLRARVDGSGIRELYTSGISSVADRPGRQAFRSLGLTIATGSGQMFWTELTTSRIQSAAHDPPGTADEVVPEDVVTAAGGVDSPIGIAVDERAGVIYWTDAGRQAIFRSGMDGQDVTRIVGREHGVVEPYGIALDANGGKLYWTDASRDVVVRANVDGSALEECSLLDDGAFAARRDVGDCPDTLLAAGRRYLADAVLDVALCLDKVDALKAVKREASDAAKAVPTCIASLDRLEPSLHRFRAAVDAACRSTGWRSEVESSGNPLASSCADASGDSTFDRWLDCAVGKHREAAEEIVARRYVRAAEWLEEVRPFIDARTNAEGTTGAAADAGGSDDTVDAARALDVARTNNAVHVLDALLARLVPPASADDLVTNLPATGQTSSYPARTDGSSEPVPVPDDGAVRAGFEKVFRDNGDGTISDLRTGLVWEKKCDGCGGLHDVGHDWHWSADGTQPTVWGWLADVNAEDGTGFAGHSDWRIPNVKELQSIVDYERFNPAVTPAFDGPLCGLGCSDLRDAECSCTRMSAYWSSTAFPGAAERAMVVAFHLGLIGEKPKTEFAYVRAVRGPDGREGAN